MERHMIACLMQGGTGPRHPLVGHQIVGDGNYYVS